MQIGWRPNPKALGPVDLDESTRYMERTQLDAMPELFLARRPIGYAPEFQACRWLTGYREMPKVRGRLGGVK